MQFAVIFKLSFLVLVAVMLLSRKVLGEHFKAEQPLDKVIAVSIEANPTMNPDDNASSIFRRKRDTDSIKGDFLRDYCPNPQRLTPGSRNPCIAGSYICLDRYVETVCRNYSFACLQGIEKSGFPRCAPDYGWLNIDLGAKGTRNVRFTKSCNCT